ncbi:MAG TPA: sulfite exporter TauE/SafE family protein [Actinomycetes bacterium]|nr:sulfite exporter TauE/SafE family protein [Actinomycetes bacterium]
MGILVHEDHAHAHGHDHDHPHEHPHPHAHAHEVPAPSRRGLVAIGLAGGLLPSPSAVLVFLGALALGHPWFGVLLVVAFGLGMAATLAVVGVLVMRLRDRAEQRLAQRPRSRFAPVLRHAPLLTASVVVLLGVALALRGLTGTGVV